MKIQTNYAWSDADFNLVAFFQFVTKLYSKSFHICKLDDMFLQHKESSGRCLGI